MSCNHKHPASLSPFVATLAVLASNFQTHVAFASVGAGAGLPYEDVFSKIVTSLTGPWAWTVAIVCVIIFAWKAVQHGGDLGGSTMAFLGPAFICTLLLGSKKLMGFFGQGAMLSSACQPRLWLLVSDLCWNLLLLAGVAGLFWVNRRMRQKADLGGPATSFVGPAFIGVLLLVGKNIVSFFELGAALSSACQPRLGLAWDLCASLLLLAGVAGLAREHLRLRQKLRLHDSLGES